MPSSLKKPISTAAMAGKYELDTRSGMTTFIFYLLTLGRRFSGPHGEERREATRLEPWATRSILRDAVLRTAPQDEVVMCWSRAKATLHRAATRSCSRA